MRYADLGETGMSVSVVGLGTWQLGGEYGKHFTQAEADRLLGRAGELGVNLIDTAECYGDHLAEQLVGHAIRADRESWILATKFGHRFHADRAASSDAGPGPVRTDHWTPEEVVAQLEASLRALGTDYVDLYQSHAGSDAQFATPGLWAALRDQVAAGKIRHLGISLDAGEEERAAGARARGAAVVQVTYNRLNRAAEETILPIAAEQGLGVLAREPLANGFLSGRYRPGSRITTPGDWRASQDPAELDARLAEVQRIAATEAPTGLPLGRWAIAWCLRHPAVSAVIPGCKTIEQLEGNVAAADLALDEASEAVAARLTGADDT